LGLAGACNVLAVAGRGGGDWAAVLATNEILTAKKNAAAANPQCKKVRFHKNLTANIAKAASQIRPRVYYDLVTVRWSLTGLAAARAE
jgi:3-keto-L-gulonate-6-phosphate decarboxylase